MPWYCSIYIVVGAITTIYMQRHEGHNIFISTICGIAWPLTWMALIFEATT